ncbi:MAG: hypothetical protein M3007_05840, partial [Candidatus Eremiobacteraeota bacterium]|nr:hypothetical protein [Candidatus Eremiobacteraeota bacterium]
MTAWRLVFIVATLTMIAIMPASHVAPAQADAYTTLPNGWRISPAGSTTALGTLPLHMIEDPSGRWLAVTNGGYGALALTIIEEATGHVAATMPLTQAFYGIAFSHDGRNIFVSTADQDAVRHFAFD